MTESTLENRIHIERVRHLLGKCAIILLERGVKHDASRLEKPEKAVLNAIGNRLTNFAYKDKEPEYRFADRKAALDHHYAHNNDHPEHYPNGVDRMSLFDLIEMLMDWKAISEEQPNGVNIDRSVEVSSERLFMIEQLKRFC